MSEHNEYSGDFSNNQGVQNIGGEQHIEGSTININIGALDNTDNPVLDTLKTQLEALQAELNNVSEAHQEEKEAVAALAEQIASQASQPKPNKPLLKISGEGLKEAAKNLASVAPIAVQIAKTLLLLE